MTSSFRESLLFVNVSSRYLSHSYRTDTSLRFIFMHSPHNEAFSSDGFETLDLELGDFYKRLCSVHGINKCFMVVIEAFDLGGAVGSLMVSIR